MIIAIDFSITSTGVCVLDNNNKMHFASFPYTDVIKKHIIQSLKDSKVHCELRTRNEDKTNLITQSRFHTEESLILANLIRDYLLELGPKSENNIIILEGFSYNSGGNRLAQISGYQFVTRNVLLNDVADGRYENLYVYAPQSIKSIAKASKKGMDKTDMISRFLDHDEKVIGTEQSEFYQDMKSFPEKFKNIPSNRTKKIVFQKPIDDIIDAYWILKTYLVKEKIIL